MAQERNPELSYEKITDLSIDWGCNPNDDNKKFAGEVVQEFIKSFLAKITEVDTSLDKESTNAIANCVVATLMEDIENRTLSSFDYEVDTDSSVLKLTAFNKSGAPITTIDIPFLGGGSGESTASKIKLTASVNQSMVKEGGNAHLTYTYDHVNADGASDGVKANIVVTVKVGATTTFEQTYNGVGAGTYTLDLSDYLRAGTVDVYVKAECTTDTGDKQSKQAYSSINVITLQLTSSFNIAASFAKGGYDNDDIIEIPYTITGSGSKNVSMHLDGSSTPVVQTIGKSGTTNGSFMIPAAALSAGRHTVQIVAERDGLLSDSIYMDILKAGSEDPFIATKITFADGRIFHENHLTPLLSCTQYEQLNFQYAVYNPNAIPATITESRNGDLHASRSVPRSVQTWTDRFASASAVSLKFACQNTEYNLNVEVAESNISYTKATQGLKFELSAAGRSNDEASPDQWTAGDVTTEFGFMSFKSPSGWNGESLVLRNGAKAVINSKLFEKDAAADGMTVEIEYRASNVALRDAQIISCLSGGRGFSIEAEKASMLTGSYKTITDEDGNSIESPIGVEMQFASNEWHRTAFVIHPRTFGRLMELYRNGGRVKADIYSEADTFLQDNPANIILDSTFADIEVRSITVYNRALTDDELLGNDVVTRPDPAEMAALADSNDIMTEDGTSIDMDKLIKRQKGVVLIVRKGGLQEVNSANDKKRKFLADVYIYTPWGDSIVYKNIYISIQGTSSTKYAAKNIRLYFEDGEEIELWVNGVKQDDFKISVVPGDNPVGVANLKCDFSDSSMAHNVAFAKLDNDLMKATDRLTPQQLINSNYRTAINGWPCDVFSAESLDETPTYFGQYNFNNDKSDWSSIIGLKDVPGIDNDKVIVLEFLNNSERLGNFQVDQDSETQFENEFDNALEFNWPQGIKWATANPYQKSAVKRLWEWIRDCVPDGADTKDFKDISSFASEKFRSEAHKYLNIRNLSGYYVKRDYTAAVDQLVKNMIWFTVDGLIWYVIFYDGDSALLVRNDCSLAYVYHIDRETWDAEKSKYAFEGHDSILWCLVLANFEDELRTAAAEIREKMTMEAVLHALDVEQCDNWSVRQYNKSGELKYIRPAIDGVDVNGIITKYPQIYALHGDRRSHRRHTVENRFSLLDGRYCTSAYRSDNIDMYMARSLNDDPDVIKVKAYEVFYFGYGTNNTPDIQTTQRVEQDEVLDLIFTNAFALNDPIRIYGASRARELDFRGSADHLTGDLNLNKCQQLRKLDLSTEGAGSKGWCLVLDSCRLLEELDVTNQPEARTGTLSSTEINLANQSRLKKLLAGGTKAQSVVLATGAPVETLVLPDSLTTLSLEDLPLLQADNLAIEGYSNISTFRFTNCPGLDWEAILAKCTNIKRLRVTGINATGDGSMLERYLGIGGVDADGNATETCALVGTYQLTNSISDVRILKYKTHYPELNILQPPYTMIESDDSIPDALNISNTDNRTGYAYDKPYEPSGHINAIRSNAFRCLLKQEGDDACICQLHNMNSNFFADAADPSYATPAPLDGSAGDFMAYMPHYWYKGINDNLNNKHYTCFSSNREMPPVPNATVILFDEILKGGRVREKYSLKAGSATLDTSFVTNTNYSVCSVDVSGYKKVRFPTVPDGGASICSVFSDADGNILKTVSVDGTRFTEGMYLISDIPEGAERLSFTIKTVAEFDKVVLSNSDKIEDMEPDWVEHTHCLIGAVKASIVDSKIRSIIGGAGANNITQADFLAYAAARGLQLVDYEMHKDAANMFYALYGNRNAQTQCGRGTDSTTRVLGVTAPAGMRDTKVITSGSYNCWYVESTNEYGDETTVQLVSPNFLGLESWWGCLSEWLCKVSVPNTPTADQYKWFIEMPDGSIRKVRSAVFQDKFIAAVHHGKYCDIIAAGTAVASETTRYCDYYYCNGTTNRVVVRSNNRANTYGGVAFSSAGSDSGTAVATVGSRLAFRGNIRIIDSVEEFLAI